MLPICKAPQVCHSQMWKFRNTQTSVLLLAMRRKDKASPSSFSFSLPLFLHHFSLLVIGRAEIRGVDQCSLWSAGCLNWCPEQVLKEACGEAEMWTHKCGLLSSFSWVAVAAWYQIRGGWSEDSIRASDLSRDLKSCHVQQNHSKSAELSVSPAQVLWHSIVCGDWFL